MHNSKRQKKIFIFIVAYNAEQHIENVLNRIPLSFLEKINYEILIIDDFSVDKTFEIARQYQKKHAFLNLKVLYNPINQGYGGNQKLGYRYAIANAFDAVVLLHGDGQYAPEYLPDIVEPILSGETDAVFGSRMINKKSALKGGMPLYKFIGNIILTKLQNKILKTNLSEFHSGYRAYSVKTLSKLPFERNSNDFHFDTQIIIQYLLGKYRIKEIPVPTYYGDEICHVNGIKYAWKILNTSIESRLHLMNIFYRIEYDIDSGLPVYDLKLGYKSSHTMAIRNTPESNSVLDIGAGTGLIARELKKKKCVVTGIDQFPQDKNPNFDAYHVVNLDEAKLPITLEKFNVILMLDIIEHISNPVEFLDSIRKKIHPNHRPKIILTTPNIAFFIIRIQLFLGNFNYGKKGILDLTHKRLFTYKSIRRLCSQTGYVIKKTKGIPAPFPQAIGKNWFSILLVNINNTFIHISKSFFSYQIYFELEPTPVVEKMLHYSISESQKKQVNMDTITK
jgi:glycosyltransferase involved in cell wall biosynthesis